MTEVLDQASRETALKQLAEWRYEAADKTIARDFKFADFAAAFGFMARVALLAEKAGHHPDWSNAYNRVSVRLSTHDAGGVTDKDIDLAGKIDAAAG